MVLPNFCTDACPVHTIRSLFCLLLLVIASRRSVTLYIACAKIEVLPEIAGRRQDIGLEVYQSVSVMGSQTTMFTG